MTKDRALKLALEELDNDSDSDDAWHQRLDAKTAIKQALAAPVQEPAAIDGNTSDGYHTFNELYEFRKAYNAALFNEWAAGGKCSVHKSWRHHDGELCFGGGWFIVVAVLPAGQISNHYEAKDWDLFAVPEAESALFEFDGHSGFDVVARLKAYITIPPAQPAPVQPMAHIVGEIDHAGKVWTPAQPAPVQEPVVLKKGECWPEAVMQQWDYFRKLIADGDRSSFPRDWFESLADMRLVDDPSAAPVQEPVAWATMLGSYSHVSWGKDRPDYPIRYEVPLYTTPPAPQRQWVGLTDEELELLNDCGDTDSYKFARAIEAKLKEKNT